MPKAAKTRKLVTVMVIPNIRNSIVKVLHEHTGAPVVPTDTTARRPDYPYITYKIISSYDSNTFSLIDEPIDTGKPDCGNGVKVIRMEQPLLNLSINTYSDCEETAHALAVKARDWFTFYGDFFFVDLNVAVVSATNITDRAQQIVEDFEMRYGFDVKIRAARAIVKRVDSIKTHDLTGTVNNPHQHERKE